MLLLPELGMEAEKSMNFDKTLRVSLCRLHPDLFQACVNSAEEDDCLEQRVNLLRLELQELKSHRDLVRRRNLTRVLPEAVTNLLPSNDSDRSKNSRFAGTASRVQRKLQRYIDRRTKCDISRSDVPEHTASGTRQLLGLMPHLSVVRNSPPAINESSHSSKIRDSVVLDRFPNLEVKCEGSSKLDFPALITCIDKPVRSEKDVNVPAHIKVEICADESVADFTTIALSKASKSSKRKRSLLKNVPRDSDEDDDDWTPDSSAKKINSAKKKALDLSGEFNIADTAIPMLGGVKEEPLYEDWNDFYDTSFLDYDLDDLGGAASDMFPDPLSDPPWARTKSRTSASSKNRPKHKQKNKALKSSPGGNEVGEEVDDSPVGSRKRPVEMIKCRYCGLELDRRRMESHVFTKHKEVKTHICDQCPFKTNCLANLTKHINNMHLGIK